LKYYRETYEGSDMDATKNLMVPRSAGGRGGAPPADAQTQDMVKSPIASSWMGQDMIRLLNSLKPGVVQQLRTIAVPQCSYSQIIQVRGWMPDEIGAIAWFSFDNPAQSPRIPIFSSIFSLPKSFEVDSQKRYREDAACWAFRKTNRLATIKWGTTRRTIEGAVADLEARALNELPAIEKIAQDFLKTDPSGKKTRDFLTQYTNDFARAVLNKYEELAGKFWYMMRGGI
jgi:dipeptidase